MSTEEEDAFAEFLAGECWELWGTELTKSHPLTKVFESWAAQKKEEERDYVFDCYVCGKRFYDDGTDKHEVVEDDEGGRCLDCGGPIDSDDEEDEEEECAICEESVQRDDVDNVDYNDDVGLWCCHKEECLRVFWKGDDFIDGIEDIRHKLRAATRKNVAIKITNTLISGIMIDAVNRAKPCRKNQCHAFTKKGFRCKNKQETKMVSPEMISQKETESDFCKTHCHH